MTRKMKDSGVEWIGKIPEDWESIKLLYGLERPITDGPHETPQYVEEGVPFITINNVDDRGTIDKVNANKISHEDFVMYNNKAKMKKGDLLFSKSATIGRIAEVDELDFMVWSPFAILSTKNHVLDNNYLKNILSLPGFIDHAIGMGSVNTQINIGMRDMEKTIIPLPNLSEQIQIANFLDKKTQEIEDIKSLIDSEIQVLEAYKKSLITEAVTKGLDRDVEMKDSGIEWIGKIPKHWKVGKTLFYLEMPITDGPHITPQLYDEGVPFVSAEAVSAGNGTINFDNIRGYVSEEFYLECCKKYTPQIDDIYMIKSGATTGKIAIVDTDKKFTIWSPLAVFRANKSKIISKYLFYILQSDYYLTQVELFWNYGTQQNIGMRTLEKLKICSPPLSEQKQIASYLDEKCSIIDDAIQKKKDQLEILEAYKKSLIYEYVTGKKEVAHG